MSLYFKFLKLFLLLIVGSFFLVGCGGSGGSDDGKTSLTDSSDKKAPQITINGKSTITITKGTTYTDAGATAKDDVDGVVSVTTSGSVDVSKVGTYTITYMAIDKAGNKAIKKRTVKVVAKKIVDTTAPIITLNGKSSITIKQGTSYTDAGATAKDNVDGVVSVTTSGSVNSSKVGTYIITYTAVDKAGNKSTAKRTVKVVVKTTLPVADTIPPVITLKGNANVSIVQGTTYTDAGATAKDNVDGLVKVTSSGSVDISKLGTYTITYRATDKAGNKATKTRKVKVILPPDTTAPVITISGDNPLEVTQGETFSDPGATAKDDRDGTVSVTPTGTVVMDTAGSYEITYTATDKAGNKSTAKRTVIVKPADVVWNVSNISEFRQALEDATANGESDRIVLAKGRYNVTIDGLSTLTFDDNEEFNLTIESADGLTSKDVILSGNKSTQVFNFNNTANSTLIFKGVSVIDGNSSSDGGGIYSSKNIEITNSIISNNTSSNSGGGFYSNGRITISNSTISNNSSGNNWSNYGGGFYSSDATTITNSTISNNSSTYNGGGFYSGTTIVTKSTISNNTSSENGGGFYSGTTTVTNSTISNNSANNGGGFYAGTTTVTNSTISNNSARYNGGGFYSSNKDTITNSIFSENNATTGAIFDSSSYSSYAYISNNTFINNKGSIKSEGIFVNNIFSKNNEDIDLVADSKIYNNYIDYSKIEDNGNNVIKKKNLQPASVGDIYLTSKYALKAKSPVIDKGLNPSSATYKKIIGGEEEVYNSDTREYETVYPQYEKMLELLKTDKVGNKRVHNGTVDMGAVEYGSSK